MLEDFPKNLLSQISERVANPLSGSFAISWAAWNYKFFVILFSSNTATTTFRLIDEISFPTIGAIVANGIIYPLLTALAYLFLYPYPAKLVYKFTRERQRDMAIIRQQIEDETPLTTAESREIRRQYRKLQEEHAKEMELQVTLTRDLKNELEARLVSSVPTSGLSENEKTAKPTQEELELLGEFSESGRTSLTEIIAASKKTRVATEYLLGELVQKGYLQVRGSGESAGYNLTHQGRKAIVENGMDLV